MTRPTLPAVPLTDNLQLQLHLRYSSEFELQTDVSLPGRGVSALFGPSGCGKTSLLRSVAGLERPQQARIAINGQIWHDTAAGIFLPTHQRPLGLVFQEASLFEHLDVQANLDFGRRRVPSAERRVSLEQAIDLLGIGHLLQRRPAQLSGGERQRVAIARALATSPRLLLMDEPLAALDAARKADLLPWFERLARELSIPVLYVTHAVDEVARLADHLLLLENGRVLTQGPVAEVLARPQVAHAQGDAASALVHGRLHAIDMRDQLLQLDFDGGRLLCPLPSTENRYQLGQPLRLRVLARDVSISLSAAQDTSILNVLPAAIVSLTSDGAAQLLVTLRIGSTTVLARITRVSARRLQLHPGQAVFAQIKAVAVLD